MPVAIPIGLLALASVGRAQAVGDRELNEAYAALTIKDYDRAVTQFQKGLALEPGNAKAHKDLAYTLLKTGENAEARDEFERAMQLDKRDETAALEYAFLAYETKKPIEARRMFDKLRHSKNASTRATAQQAFANIDKPLESGIARWQEALRRAPDPRAPATFSAHWELGQLAELRDELTLAAEQYEICRELKPQLAEVLLILARLWGELNQVEQSRAVLLAASRSRDSRTAELALEQLGTRYPYPYEFVAALKIDPRNSVLRKELAYLYLAMQKEPEAIEQFEAVLAMDPADEATRKQLDLLRGLKTRPVAAAAVKPVQSNASAKVSAKEMGKKSLALGYLNDAVKYLQQAHEQDPDDAEIDLLLGRAYNQQKHDDEAIEWFDRARRTGDLFVASEASRAYHNLRGDTLPQTTIWTLPMYSSRWKDVFSYGQIKRTLPLPFLGRTNKYVSVYLSMRFAGDVRSTMPAHVIAPQYLSESSFIFGGGVATKTWHHITAWGEAGEAVNYLPFRRDIGTAIPDYRGGLNYAKGFGHLLGSKSSGLFFESVEDAEYIHRFNKDWLFYSQNRGGRTFRFGDGVSAQAVFNVNYVRDVKREYWANTLEIGPGLRLRLPWMPPNMYFSADLLHGYYTTTSPKPNYNDVRVSVWYAVTK